MKSRSRVENSWFCAGYVYFDNGTRGQKSEAETTQGEPTGGGRVDSGGDLGKEEP